MSPYSRLARILPTGSVGALIYFLQVILCFQYKGEGAEIHELKALLKEFKGSTFTTISEVSEIVGNHIKTLN